MDQLDAAILREMLRDRALLWGGGDPRLGIADFAARLGVDRTTVWARLRAWRRDGFLVRHEVLPNPGLLDLGVATGDISVRDPRRKAKVVEALSLMDGVLGCADMVGPYILLLFAHDSPAALSRCTRLVQQLPGVDAMSVCIPFEPPRSRVEPTAADWRILAAMRRAPEGPLRRVAEEAGISTRTLTRRYGELLQADALWWFPVLDFTRYRHAVLARFLVEAEADPATLVNACRRGRPETVWWHAEPDDDGRCWLDLHAHFESAAEVEGARAWLLDQPGVGSVEVFFPRAWLVFGEWLDEHIARRARPALARAG